MTETAWHQATIATVDNTAGTATVNLGGSSGTPTPATLLGPQTYSAGDVAWAARNGTDVLLVAKRKADIAASAYGAITGTPPLYTKSNTASATFFNQSIAANWHQIGAVYCFQAEGDMLYNSGAPCTPTFTLSLGGTTLATCGAAVTNGSTTQPWQLVCYIHVTATNKQTAWGWFSQQASCAAGGAGAGTWRADTAGYLFHGAATATVPITSSATLSFAIAHSVTSSNVTTYLNGWAYFPVVSGL